MFNILKWFQQDKIGQFEKFTLYLNLDTTEEKWKETEQAIKYALEHGIPVNIVANYSNKEKPLGKIFADVDVKNSYGY